LAAQVTLTFPATGVAGNRGADFVSAAIMKHQIYKRWHYGKHSRIYAAKAFHIRFNAL
jgi:hypothetical protein